MKRQYLMPHTEYLWEIKEDNEMKAFINTCFSKQIPTLFLQSHTSGLPWSFL